MFKKLITKVKASLQKVVTVVSGVCLAVVASPACRCLAATANTTPELDTSIVDTLIAMLTSILGLFSVFPLNIFLVAGFIGLAIGIFMKLKGGAR